MAQSQLTYEPRKRVTVGLPLNSLLRRGSLALVALAPSAAVHAQHIQAPSSPIEAISSKAISSKATSSIGGGSLSFVRNDGQYAEEVVFHSTRAGLRAWFTSSAFVVELAAGRSEDLGKACALRFEMHEARPRSIVGEQPRDGLRHFLKGNVAESWRRDVPSFARVVYEDAWPGVEVVVREGAGAFEYDLLLDPGASLKSAVFHVEGALGLSIKEGALVVATELGELRQTAPVAWSVLEDGARSAVACRFVIRSATSFGFEADDLAPGAALVVDPGVEWSSYIGAFDEDIAQDVVFAVNGDIVIAGTTLSYEYPVTLGAYDVSVNGARDAFVTRFAADGGSLVYSTLLGGTADDWGVSLAVADGGKVWVTGDTDSSDFPVLAGGQDLTHNGGTDVFVAKLGPSGATLLHSTFFGASAADHASGLVLTPAFEPVIAGWSDSSNLPTTSLAFDGSANGGRDAFLASWTPDLAGLRFSSMLGGSGNDMARGLARTVSGELFVVGLTSSSNFPVSVGAFDATHNAGASVEDGFVSAFTADAGALLQSTYFGGTQRDVVEAVALDAAGDVWFVGSTESADLPTTSAALEPTYLGLEDGFAAQLTSGGQVLGYSSYIAGTDRDRAVDLVVDSFGQVSITGETRSSDFPKTPWSFDPTFNGQAGAGIGDAFVLRLDSSGALDYGAFLGGVDEDFGLAMALDSVGGAVVAGATNSYNFPTTFSSHDSSYDLSYIYDGFVTRFDFAHFPHNFGVAKINSSNSWAVLGYNGFPSLSGSGFTLYLDGGIPFSYGFLFWSTQSGGGPFMGGELLMGPPYTRTGQLPLDWFGSAIEPISIDATMVGSTLYYQAWYADPSDPFGVGLSDGLAVTYYP